MVILMATFAIAGIGSAGVQEPALAALLDEHWEAYLEASPVGATQLGDHRYDDRLDDNSPQARAAWDAKRGSWLARAAGIQPASVEDQLSLRLFVDDQQTSDADAPRLSEAGAPDEVGAGWAVGGARPALRRPLGRCAPSGASAGQGTRDAP